MKKLILIALLFSSLFLAGGIWFVSELRPVNNDNTLKNFEISPGVTAYQIGIKLQKEKLIKSSLAFRIYSQISQAAKSIKPGTYELSSNLWIPQITNKLLEGPINIWVTLPEGLRREEIADKFINSLGLTKNNNVGSFKTDFLKLTENKEGYLFPDTYLVSKDAIPSEVVKMLENNFKKKVNFPVSSDIIILASIIERETKTNEERPIVAGILLKRINAGWPIQADATIQYILGNWNPITPNDLKIDSPYNTYLNTGLPPTPICNPGLSSILAAKNPADSDYWYYLHDKDGNIHYAKTIEEQNTNIAKYLQ